MSRFIATCLRLLRAIVGNRRTGRDNSGLVNLSRDLKQLTHNTLAPPDGGKAPLSPQSCAVFASCSLIFMLSACNQPANYAPVIVVNQAFRTDASKPQTVVRKPSPSSSTKTSIHKRNGQEHHDLDLTPPVENRAPSKNFKPTTSSASYSASINRPQAKSGKPTTPDKKSDPKQNPGANTLTVAQTIRNNRTIGKKPSSQDKIDSNSAIAMFENMPAQTKNNKKETQKTSTISNINKKVLKLKFGWPIRGKVIKNFAQSNRKGIDIIGKTGQTVHAAEAGKAVYCGQGLAGYGKLIILKHNPVYLSAYAHNSQLNISEGQLVEKGQPIGIIGNKQSKQALLHFEIRKNGSALNPLALLPTN